MYVIAHNYIICLSQLGHIKFINPVQSEDEQKFHRHILPNF